MLKKTAPSVDCATLSSALTVVLLVWISVGESQFGCHADPGAEAGAGAESGLQNETQYAVNTTLRTGDRLLFPLHPLYTQPFPEKLLARVRDDYALLLREVRDFARIILIKPPGLFSHFKWKTVSLRIAQLRDELAEERLQDGLEAREEPVYMKEFHALLADLVKQSQEVVREFKNLKVFKSHKHLTQMTVRMIDVIAGVCAASPVAGYVDWLNGRVGNLPFAIIALEVFSHLLYLGYGPTLHTFMQQLRCQAS